MSDKPQKCIPEDEEIPLNLISGSGETQKNDDFHKVTISTAICCEDKHHRKLAICSIICGISCIGINALINSVKAEKTEDPTEAAEHLRQAKKLGITSIGIWILILVSFPILLALISYVLTLID